MGLCASICCPDLLKKTRYRKTVLCFAVSHDAGKALWRRKCARTFGASPLEPTAASGSDNFSVESFDIGKSTTIELFDISGTTKEDRVLWNNYFNIRSDGVVFIIDGSRSDDEIEDSIQQLVALLSSPTTSIIKPRSGNDQRRNRAIRDTPLLLLIATDGAKSSSSNNSSSAAATRAASADASSPSSSPSSSPAPAPSSQESAAVAVGEFATNLCAKFRIQERLVRAARNKILGTSLTLKKVEAGLSSSSLSSSSPAASASNTTTASLDTSSNRKEMVGVDHEKVKVLSSVSGSTEELASIAVSPVGGRSPTEQLAAALQSVKAAAATAAAVTAECGSVEVVATASAAAAAPTPTPAASAAASVDKKPSQKYQQHQDESGDVVDEFTASDIGTVSLKSFRWGVYEISTTSGLGIETSMRWLVNQMNDGANP